MKTSQRHLLALAAATAAALAGGPPAPAAPYTWNKDTDETVTDVISGTEGLDKYGSGTLTLDATNTFTGTISIHQGVLAFTSGSNSADSALGAGTTGILLDGGTLRYTGTANSPNIGGGGATHPLTLGVNGGAIEAGSPNRYLILGQTGNLGLSGNGARTLTLGGGTTDLRNKISLKIGDQGGATSLVKTGTATWTIDGANTYSGTTAINQGRLQLGSATTLQGAAGDILINGGLLSAAVATTVGGNIVLSSGGIDTVTIVNASTITPNAVSLTLASGKTFTMSGGTWTVDLFADGSRDQINGTAAGSFSLTGGTQALRMENALTFDYGMTYSLLDGFGSGSVSGLKITGYDTDNWLASLSSSGVLSFASAAIPEPSTLALLAGAAALLAAVQLKSRRIPPSSTPQTSLSLNK